MKKKFLLGLGLILIISLTACGKKETSELENNPDVIIDEETGIILVDPESELASGTSTTSDGTTSTDNSKECGSQPDFIEPIYTEVGNIEGKWIDKDNQIIFEAKRDSKKGDTIMLLSKDKNALYSGQLQADNFFSNERKDYNYHFEQGNLHISIDDIDYIFEPATETEFNSLYDLYCPAEIKEQVEKAEKVLDATTREGYWVAEDNSLALFFDGTSLEYIDKNGYSRDRFMENETRLSINIHDNNYIEDYSNHAFYYELKDGGLYVTPILITCEYAEGTIETVANNDGNETTNSTTTRTLTNVKTEELPTVFMNKVDVDDFYYYADLIIQQ